MEINETYKNSGLGKWFDEKWVDISRKDKSGKHPPCGDSAEKRKDNQKKAYPKCRPAKEASKMSPKLKEKATQQKRRAEKKEKHHKGRKPVTVSHENLKENMNLSESKNKPNNPQLWSRAQSIAKSKFDVHPSAYCVPLYSEALTKNGWKKYDKLNPKEEILAYDPKSDTLKWTEIQDIHYYEKTKTVKMKKLSFDITCTPNHKWLYFRNSFEEEIDLKKINRYFSLIQDIKLGNEKISNIKKNNKSIQYWYKKYKDCNYEEFLQNVRKKKGKKFVETKDLLKNGNLLISAKLDEQYRSSRPILGSKYKQNWVGTILNMSIEQLESFFMASIIYDGWNRKKGSYGFSQKNKDHGEAFELAAFLTGHRVSQVGKKRSDGVQAWSVLDKRYLPLVGVKIIDDEIQNVWCPQTKYSTWVMRQKGRIMITGNSNAYASKWYKKKGGTWRKSMLKEHNMPTFKQWLKNKS